MTNLSGERANLSGELTIVLRDMIMDGRLAPGERVNEVQLATTLGVSRTPLREALSALTLEGALSAVPRIGWFVRPVTLEEFEQIYPIRAILDPEALRLARLPSPRRLERLRRLNGQIEKERDAGAVIALDDRWHMMLIEACPNHILLDLIRQFIRRTRRYELALMRDRRNVEIAAGAHERIMDALEREDIEGACAALRANLESGAKPISDWLREREADQEKVE